MTQKEAIEFFNKYAAAMEKEGVISAIGPAFLHTPDRKWVETFAQILAAHSSLDGCIIVADENGIHWPAIREAAFVIKYLETHTARMDRVISDLPLLRWFPSILHFSLRATA